MTNATQPMKLAIGAESLIVPYLERDDMDEVQLITADGQHFALIQQSPAWENADLIVKAVNSHDALVAALEACQIALRTHSPNVPEDEQGWTSYDEEAIEAANAALEQVK